ncbi:T9SS type A sorting domain-containing protein [Polaribacter cellanae]|uniref:T9SS type A sorting domain-containing protein n=1 Tax=Polaribacter cellanae TaxID=2818493 RepID=A0A975CMT1_9FLAO|nr:T9SS type A sorting domain-containing protein [Polaribacter cellanae]QTE21504.1 T9SS type A sorting domain-containing protein [Polaribacter cellanae]
MKNYKELILFTLSILFNVKMFSQNVSCNKTVHGKFTHIHMNCTKDILVTSLPKDSNGTIIRGVITTTGTIIIKPGNTFVRILANGAKSKGSNIQTHTTKIGSNGNVGGKASFKKKVKLVKNINVYPNKIKDFLNIRADATKIISYQLYDFLGKNIKKENLKYTNKVTVPVSEIKKGIYLLKIQLANGTQQIKKIIKN